MQAVYLSALTLKGPELLVLHPKKKLKDKEKLELALKTLPMNGKEGDFVTFPEGLSCKWIILL